MREDIEFDAEGATLRGWFYRPDDANGEVPCIVMAHGFSAVKEMHLDEYADVFSAAGLACAAFETAAPPKKLMIVPGGHFDAYVGRGFEISSGAARDWFVEHLVTAAAVSAPQAAPA